MQQTECNKQSIIIITLTVIFGLRKNKKRRRRKKEKLLLILKVAVKLLSKGRSRRELPDAVGDDPFNSSPGVCTEYSSP